MGNEASSIAGASQAERKARGAFFTPPQIADFLARWAISNDASASIMDPTCGESVFLEAAGKVLSELGAAKQSLASQLTGIDIHQHSLDESKRLLARLGLDARLVCSDFFDVLPPSQMGGNVDWQDAVIGNPPFVRYQDHRGESRRRSHAAALAQGVRLTGLASSWAATLVHASAFLKPTGRLAMVLPAELLTVGYAEPIRRWFRQRFQAVNLVMFEQLQFQGATENVVLLVARGPGPCDSFCLFNVNSADDLRNIHPLDPVGASPASEGKWSDLLLPLDIRNLYRKIASESLCRLDTYGTPELGTVTGANDFFTLSEVTRRKYAIHNAQVKPISPPGTKHLKGLSFTRAHWEELKLAGERVWILDPHGNPRAAGLNRYLDHGEKLGVPSAYKCTVREPWWRPPLVGVPDLYFTYMSHRYPRLVANTSGATFVNSMHGIRLRKGIPSWARDALPLLCLNSATMVGAEIVGRAYGGGILKLEPREAAALPVPGLDNLKTAWEQLKDRRANLDAALRRGEWWTVVADVDAVLLKGTLQLTNEAVTSLRDASTLLRVRRTRQNEPDASTTAAGRSE